MTDHQESLNRTLTALAGDIGANVAYLEPDDSPHIDPVTVVIAVAGVLAHSFLTGFIEEAKSRSQKAGAKTFDALDKRLVGVFAGRTTVSQADVAAAAETAGTLRGSLPPDALDHAARSAEDLLAKELEAQGLPPPRARALAAEVRAKALALAADLAG